MVAITDDEWADFVAHELPNVSDPVIQKYLESRRALIAEQQKRRSVHLKELLTTGQTIPSARALKSWRIIRRMPKGALLRTHCCSLADIDHLIETALEIPGVSISCPTSHLATVAARKETGLCIRFRGMEDPDDCSLWAHDYTPGTFMSLTKAAGSYPEGGRQGFVEWLKGRCRMSGPSSGDSDLTGLMLFYEPIWRAFLQRLMTNLVEEGIAWLELRLTFPLVYYREGSEVPEPDYDHMFQTVGEEVARFQATDPGRRFWGLRVIWSTMRNQDPRLIIESADDCIATKLVWPHLVAGYDLADSEDLGRPLADLLPELFWFRKQCAVEKVQIPFFLRAGGCRGNYDTHATGEGDIVDALLLGARRIGHATSLHRHPRLVEAVRDRRILVEVRPVSEKGRDPSADVAMHHGLRALLAQGVPCALCDDDSGILPRLNRNVGSRMTDIFWQVLHAWEESDLATLGSLAENSVRWAAFEDQDLQIWYADENKLVQGQKISGQQAWGRG
ncbi:Metallo-dependent hydrolase [Parathielavia appendiculata]|uniref:Metallo-dependent hydrolase n=1 Tax=Parathielavia appendiculata TaxID=2587402 RepID=A0AAN6Z1V3_9PEZI|nr:Metallo-dependent hydrolase [Parathielavia appendiculata]